MSPTRRTVLIGLGGTLAYALQVGCSPGERAQPAAPAAPPTMRPGDDPRGRPNEEFDVHDWLVVSADGSVTVYTSRTELGQGLTTVMHDLVGQAMELPRERVNVVLGDTDVCPHHGPTTGSAATQYVGWAFWIACHQIKADLVLLAAESSARPADRLAYRGGEIIDEDDPDAAIGIGELADGRVRRVVVDPVSDSADMPAYIDRGTFNANGEAIVTGTLRYTGDYLPEGCLYGAYVTQEYHRQLSRLRIVSLREARETPGVVRVRPLRYGYAVLAESYPAARRGLARLNPKWYEPQAPVEFDIEATIRAGAELDRVVEELGDAEAALQHGDELVRETYMTHFMSQVPLETDTAIAAREDGRLTVRLGNQNPFWVRHKVAEREGVDAEQVHVISSPAGGAFGAKADNIVGEEAAHLLQLTDRPVKLVYSRDDDIRRLGRYKEAVVFDVASAIDGEGRILARTIDIYQDEGFGTQYVYRIPDTRTRLFSTRLPVRHGTMRGTSYVQSVYGMESHTDSCARAIGMDPLEFRRRNVLFPAFERLIDACGEMFDHGNYQPPPDTGIGFGLCNHGGSQLGVVGAEVRVDRGSGVVSVVRLAGAFDFGLVINRNLAVNGVKSSMIWGLGAALFEEVEIDGWRCHTTGFGNYRIARMSDVPPIEVAFFDNHEPGRPRGCGEMPLPPTVAAIANAVYDAVGVRLHEIPMTPERVQRALAGP
jgi:isoquinoline 1-oxidoreductase